MEHRVTPGGGAGGEPLGEPDLEVSSIAPPDKAVRERGTRLLVVNQELVRAGLAVLLLMLVAAVVVIALIRAPNWEAISELLNVALPALTGLLGSAVGFYFGSRS